MTPLLAVDICNTLADVNGQILKIAGRRTLRDRYGLEDLVPDPERFFISHPEMFSQAKPLPDALLAMRKLAFKCRIAYVSARPEWARKRTEAWLEEHQLPPGPLLLTKDKAAVVRELNPLFMIEDAPHEIAKLSSVCPILTVGQPYNRGLTWTNILMAV